MVPAQDGPHARAFFDRLARLYQAAGAPAYERLVEHCLLNHQPVSISSLQEWMTGKTVPSSGSRMVFHVLVERLEHLAEKRLGLEYKRSRAEAWEAWRKAAAEERRRLRRHAAPHRMAARSGTWARRQAGQAEETVPSAELANVPVYAEEFFVGRDEELRRLTEALTAPGNVVVQAIHGLGGIGKSTLAARWANDHVANHLVTWWITADTEANIETGLAELATALQPEFAGAPLNVLTERAIGWLAANRDWVLILNNVIHPADVQPLLARARSGRVVVTSRLAEGWHHITAAVIRLDVLAKKEAAHLLTRIAGHDRPDADLEGAEELCEQLGYLPLAIEQAAGFLHQNHLTPQAYLELLAAAPTVVYDQAAEGADAERTIARIWRVTLDRLAASPLAGQLLRVLAWYGPDTIPRSLLTSLGKEPVSVEVAIGRLAAYNMITLAGEAVRVHRLVQAVARTADPRDPHRQPDDIAAAREQATRLLDNAMEAKLKLPTEWPAIRALMPHVAVLTSHAQPVTDTAGTARLLINAGEFLAEHGAVARAVIYHQRAYNACVRIFGPQHPHTLVALGALVNSHGVKGDIRSAVEGYEQLLAENTRTLGPDHPDTLSSWHQVAYWKGRGGDAAGAAADFEKIAQARLRILGPDHPDTLKARSNVARWTGVAGDAAGAVSAHEEVLKDRLRLLGKDHPDTLTTRHEIAYWRGMAGDAATAVAEYEQVVRDRLRVLGPDDLGTLTSQGNLALFRAKAGDPAGASAKFADLLKDFNRVLGPDHPHTLTTRAHYATFKGEAGDPAGAAAEFEQLLRDRLYVLPADHPVIAETRRSLAKWRKRVDEPPRGNSAGNE